MKVSDPDFQSGIQAVVDYRGDVTVILKSGATYSGYVYNASPTSLDMFPRDSSRKETLKFADIVEVNFSGDDAAKGKSWEDWAKKRAAEKSGLASLATTNAEA